MAKHVPGKKHIGNGVYSTESSGYSKNEHGALVLPTTTRGTDPVQRGEQTQFIIQEKSLSGVDIGEPELVESVRGNGTNSIVKVSAGAGVDVDSPESNYVQQDHAKMALGTSPPIQPLRQAPKLSTHIDINGVSFSLKWHACVVEEMNRKDDASPVNSVILIYDLNYDPDFDIKLPENTQFQITLSASDGKNARLSVFYGGQAFTYDNKRHFILICDSIEVL